MKLKTLATIAVTVAAATLLGPAPSAMAGHARTYTGGDYCAVHNGDNWSLVGGASCNANHGHSANSAWEASYIIHFAEHTVDTVTGEEPASFGGGSDADFMTYLNANFANPGWMYVANETGKGAYVYLMVKCASSKHGPDWAIEGTCAPA